MICEHVWEWSNIMITKMYENYDSFWEWSKMLWSLETENLSPPDCLPLFFLSWLISLRTLEQQLFSRPHLPFGGPAFLEVKNSQDPDFFPHRRPLEQTPSQTYRILSAPCLTMLSDMWARHLSKGFKGCDWKIRYVHVSWSNKRTSASDFMRHWVPSTRVACFQEFKFLWVTGLFTNKTLLKMRTISHLPRFSSPLARQRSLTFIYASLIQHDSRIMIITL